MNKVCLLLIAVLIIANQLKVQQHLQTALEEINLQTLTPQQKSIDEFITKHYPSINQKILTKALQQTNNQMTEYYYTYQDKVNGDEWRIDVEANGNKKTIVGVGKTIITKQNGQVLRVIQETGQNSKGFDEALKSIF